MVDRDASRRAGRRFLRAITLSGLIYVNSAPCGQYNVGRKARESEMFDVILLAIGFAFFALCIAYTAACEKL
jgi:hypothetical protein